MKNLLVLMLPILGGCGLHTACVSQRSAPTYNTAGVGEVATISGKAVFAPTAAALKRILDTNSEAEFFRVTGIEARSAGWTGAVFLGPPDRVTVLQFDSIPIAGSPYSSVPVARVRVEEISGAPAAGTLQPNEREGWIILKAIDRDSKTTGYFHYGENASGKMRQPGPSGSLSGKSASFA